jgi:hypothetical protein
MQESVTSYATIASGEHPTTQDTASGSEHSTNYPSTGAQPIHASTDSSTGDASASNGERRPSTTPIVVTTGYTTSATGPADGSSDTNLSSSQQSLKLHTSYDSSRQHITDSLYNTITVSTAPSSHSVSLSVSAPASPVSARSSSFSAHPAVSANQSVHSNGSSSSSSTGSSTISQSLTVVTPIPPSSSGESIYRTIMNRLTALETNTSLYARFVEDHTANVREMLRKLSEEVGRLEGLVGSIDSVSFMTQFTDSRMYISTGKSTSSDVRAFSRTI